MDGGSCRRGDKTCTASAGMTNTRSSSLSDVARRLTLRLLPVRPTAMATPANQREACNALQDRLGSTSPPLPLAQLHIVANMIRSAAAF